MTTLEEEMVVPSLAVANSEASPNGVDVPWDQNLHFSASHMHKNYIWLQDPLFI